MCERRKDFNNMKIMCLKYEHGRILWFRGRDDSWCDNKINWSMVVKLRL